MRITPLLLAALLLAGCASPRTNLIARTGGTPLPAQIHNVSLMPRTSHGPGERALESQLAVELQRHGFNVVPPDEADFTISATAESNWDTHTQTVYPEVRRNPAGIMPGSSLPATSEPDLVPVRIEQHIQTQGIRLRLYDTRTLKQGRFQTAWEGYIEAGLQLRPEQQPHLLQILCDYLGRDFTGHVRIGK